MKKMIVLGMILMLGVLLCAGNIFAKEKNKKVKGEEQTKITSTEQKESEPSPNPFMKNFIILTSRSFQALRLCWKGQTYY
ncbi:MAG TPA: hypothetical protein VJC03_03910 [bacterium]|nr:hypothetical protein [bacterium]